MERHWPFRAMSFAVAVAVVLFVWNWDYTYFIKEIYPSTLAGWVGASIAIAIAWKHLHKGSSHLLKLPDAVFAWGFALVALVASAVVAYVCYDAMPHVQDEIDYLFQARLFASGKLYAQSHPLAEFFNFRFIVNDGKWYALFQPGWPLALVPFVWLGIPYMAAPVYSALAVYVSYYLFKETAGKAVAVLATFMLVSSPFFLFMSASQMSHPFSMLLTVASMLFVLRAIRYKKPAYAAAAGFALGLLFNTRGATGLAILLAIMAYVIVTLVKNPRLMLLRLVPAGLLGALPMVLLFVGYNYALSGNPFTLPQQRYFQLTESNENCHTLGLGKGVGCRREHGPDIFWKSYTPRAASFVTHKRLNSLKGDIYSFSAIFILLIPALVLGGTSALGLWYLLLFLALVGVYYLYYYHGNCYGARYYFEALPALVYLFALGAVSSARLNKPAWAGRLFGSIAFGLIVALAGYSLLVRTPKLWKKYDNGFWGMNSSCIEATKRAKVKDAIVFGDHSDKFYRKCFAYLRLPIDEQPVIFARDLFEHNENLIRYYPNRKAYKFDGYILKPIKIRKFAPDIFIEGEAKFPAPYLHDGWNEVQSMRQISKEPFSGNEQLLFHGKHAGASIGFNIYVFEPGKYKLMVGLGNAFDYGNIQIYIDGKPVCPVLDCYTPMPLLAEHRCLETLQLSKGNHKIVFQVVGKNARSAGYLVGIDYVRLIRIDRHNNQVKRNRKP